MKLEEKTAAVSTLHEKFDKATLAILTECSGMPVNTLSELRKKLRGAKAEYRVVKNTMAARAVEGTSLAGVAPEFKGPLAMVLGYDDPVLPTKILRDFIQTEKHSEKMKMRVGVFEGKLLQPADIAAVANLPMKEVLLAMLLSGLQGPIRGLVFAMSGLLRNLVGVVQAISTKKGEGGDDMATTAGKMSTEDLTKAVESMTVLELSEWVKQLEERFGVTAAAPVAVAAAPGGGGAAAAVEEKDEFDVILASAPADKKIQVIKVVRELTSLGLKEAKDLVEGAPKPVKAGVPKEEAETIKKKLEASGATVEVK